jgi:hypothetical protein
VESHKGSRSESAGQPHPEVGNYWLKKSRNDQPSDTLESPDIEDQYLWKMMKRVIGVPTLSFPFKCRVD